MPLLPYDRFSIDSSLTVEEVRRILGDVVEPLKWFRLVPGRCAFEGEVASDSFQIRRIIGYRNSFLPRIRGRIISTPGGSTVEGTMSLHPFVLAFMCVWLSGVILIGGGVSIAMLTEGDSKLWAFIPPAMFVFGWILTSGAFTFEARKARALLVTLLASSTLEPRAVPPVT